MSLAQIDTRNGVGVGVGVRWAYEVFLLLVLLTGASHWLASGENIVSIRRC